MKPGTIRMSSLMYLPALIMFSVTTILRSEEGSNVEMTVLSVNTFLSAMKDPRIKTLEDLSVIFLNRLKFHGIFIGVDYLPLNYDSNSELAVFVQLDGQKNGPEGIIKIKFVDNIKSDSDLCNNFNTVIIKDSYSVVGTKKRFYFSSGTLYELDWPFGKWGKAER